MSKENLIQVANLSELEIVKFVLPLLIYGLINTKEKRREKLTAFLPAFFYVKKGLCAENAEANSERNLYAPPLGLVQSLHVM